MNVPDDAHGLPLLLHNAELGVLTQRSLLPVSRCNRNFCAGVPNVALAKYKVSYTRQLLVLLRVGLVSYQVV